MAEKETVPVMANVVPWNEAVLRGVRTFKTLHFNWKHRGPVLLYNSKSRVDLDAAEDYGIDASAQPRGAIVGYAFVTDVVSDGWGFLVLLARPQRFSRPIPFTPPRGAIRIFRAPRSLLRRAALTDEKEKANGIPVALGSAYRTSQ